MPLRRSLSLVTLQDGCHSDLDTQFKVDSIKELSQQGLLGRIVGDLNQDWDVSCLQEAKTILLYVGMLKHACTFSQRGSKGFDSRP